MDTLTLEQFHVALVNDGEGQENALFEMLRSLRELAFTADDLLDGVGAGWHLWF